MPTIQRVYSTPPLPARFQLILLATVLIVSTKHSHTNGQLEMVTNRTHALNEMEEDWGMVERKGTHFVVNNQPFFVNGFNTYWLMVFAVDHTTRKKVSEVFREAAAIGLTVCRTWAFNDGGWRALQTSPFVCDEEVFKALDFVVSEARRHKIRLILSFCNNWEEYGGKAQYVKWGKAAGLNLTCDDDFFSDQTIKSYYKAFVKTVITRINTLTNVAYKDDPTIFAWELMNEPRCTSDPSGDRLQAWVEEMASYVKSIDPIHLLEIGVEGFYGLSTPERLHLNPNTFAGQAGTDFIRNHQVSSIDFASVHIYSDTWLPESESDAQLQFVKTWMQHHMDDAEKLLAMPVVFGEFGVSVKDEKFSFMFREAFIKTVYKTVLSSRKRGGSGGGCLLWQLFPEGTEYMDDGYAVILAKHPTTQHMLSVQSRKLQTIHSKGFWKFLWSWKKSPMGNLLHHEEL
ncbi:mannan endo-1,4-beta-mannosidase 8 isoform X1 [Elaeis guineensis]|uniref:mannan endo-1,4-beta-mannosidase n=1 Tax=Elaeis guineensis var. tenera TaxID=51953 RepID=A0A6I9RAV3_ELAGV|nr:mannan endo-1,4-beta-mannosidase 8 isoform X1 [Elaeis guineensis]